MAAGTAGTFLAALAFLAGQVRDGRDAALGPAEPVATRQPREVVVRRVIRRVVITHPAPRAAAPAGGAPARRRRAGAPRPPRRRPPRAAPARPRRRHPPRARRPGARTRSPDHPLLVTALHELAVPRNGDARPAARLEPEAPSRQRGPRSSGWRRA